MTKSLPANSNHCFKKYNIFILMVMMPLTRKSGLMNELISNLDQVFNSKLYKLFKNYIYIIFILMVMMALTMTSGLHNEIIANLDQVFNTKSKQFNTKKLWIDIYYSPIFINTNYLFNFLCDICHPRPLILSFKSCIV